MKNHVLTTGEAAKFCGVNFRTVIRWIERGKLKAYKLPGRGDHRIREEDFVLFLRENEIPIPEELAHVSRSVLVIEDDADTALIIERVLVRAGYEVHVANDGFIAGSLMSSLKPGLVTLDLQMPGMDGYQVLRYIRENDDLSGVKVLVVSSESEEGLQRALDAGANAVLPKPFLPETLIQQLQSIQ